MGAYERALETLYKTPLAQFIAVRGRLVAELGGAGDRPAAARLGTRRRPSISAWTVNQLYWRARGDFDRMLAGAERLRGGELDASSDYRRALATLRLRASGILKEAGHAAGDAVLGRVANTLAAIAVAGFEPDLAGTLSADRDPPGFDIGPVAYDRRPAPHAKTATHDCKRRDDAAKERAAAKTERGVTELAERRRAAERARQIQERQRIEREVVAARAEVERGEQAVGRRRAELRVAEEAVQRARERLERLERSLRSLHETS